MYIKVRNILPETASMSYLSVGESIGAGTLKVRNINGFAANQAVQVGTTNEETAEILITGTAAVSGTSLVLTGTARFDHPADTPVYAIRFDQIIFKCSTAGTSGTAVAMTGSTVTITPNNEYTQFYDTAGASNYAYKASYYNSVTTEESSDSDWLMSSGFSFYSLAKLRERVKRKLTSANFIKEDEVVNDWINEWLETMTNVVIDVNKDYGIGTVDISFSGTTELGTITSTDFKEIRKVWFTTDGTNWYQMTKMDLNDFYPDQTFGETHPYFFYQGDNIIGRKPADTTGTARVYYYKTNTIMDDDTDELPVSMHNYTKGFIDYALAQAYYLDNKDTKGDKFMGFAKNSLEVFRSEIAPRHKTGPQYVDTVAPINAEDDLELL